MTSSDILKRICENQLLLATEFKEKLGPLLTESLKEIFQNHEIFVEGIRKQTHVHVEDIEKLQNLWELLTTSVTKKSLASKEGGSNGRDR